MGKTGLKHIGYNFRRGWMLYLFLIPPLAYLVIFRYLPMYGVVIAFQDFNPRLGFFSPEQPWVWLENFKEVFANPEFFQVLRNTLLLNFLDLLFSFPAPIILALLLNELRFRRFKRVSQTLLYLPYFLSWAIIGGIVYQVFSSQHGLLNMAIKSLGLKAIPFLMEPVPWVFTYLAVGIWQSAGWGTILYLAAISGINLELYDAAKVDGAGKLRSMWHITLPEIRPTIAIILILQIGRMMTIGFDRPFIIGNVLVKDVSDVISTFVYRVGLQVGRFSIAAAVGLFQGAVGMVLVYVSNFLTKKNLGIRNLVRRANMRRPLSMKRVLGAVYDYGIALVILGAVLVCLLPILHVAAISLSSNSSIINDRVTILPVEITLRSYVNVLSDPTMLQSMLVTIVITVFYTILGMVLTVLAAYPLTKKWLPGRNILVFLFLFTLFFGGGDIPNYLLVKQLGLLNTLLALILPAGLSIWNMIILKTFFMSIPESLMESAHIDGANEMTILLKIVLPLSLPVIASLCLFYAVFKWNSFQDALYYITDKSLQPLQLKLYNIIADLESPAIAIQEGANTQTNQYPESLKAASVMFATIPIVCIYPWLQKYFIKGLTVGSIKG